MIVPQRYDALVTENRQLFDHDDYLGYLDKESRRATANVFAVMGQDLSDAQHRLNHLTNQIAKDLSISIFNSFNDMLKGINQLSAQLHQEREYTLYQLPELDLKSAMNLLEMDRAMIQSYSTFRTQVSAVTKSETPQENELGLLEDNFRDFQDKLTRRYEKVQSLGSCYEDLQEKAGQVGNLIDERDLDRAEKVVASMFETENGFLRPYLDLIEQFRNRQMFHSTRLERGLQRDEQSLKFFDLYVTTMEQFQAHISRDRDNVALSPFLEKAEQLLERLPKIKEKRDDVYEKSAPREQVEEEAESAGAGPGGKFPLVALGVVVVLVIVVVLLLIF